MDETTQRRLLGASALLAGALLVSFLLPDPQGDGPDGSPTASDTTPKVVVYDLGEPVRAVPAEPVKDAAAGDAAKPSAPAGAPALLNLDEVRSPPATSLGWYVQLGSYASPSSAQAALARATQAGFSGSVQGIEKDKKKLYRTRIGPFASNAEAQEARQAMVQLGFADARMIELWKP